ncbi:MAG TPA: peptide-methionine (S)-S-oxide reductase MsrA [Terriglobales bacterium]|jgi:peptide-methionine (S)-S-oxide reductase|nr:peptide-methionine (S)-S-oxide reductase MsrA [Terriglobales bacterium]
MNLTKKLSGTIFLVMLVAVSSMRAAENAVVLPDPVGNTPLAAKSSKETTVFAGGCFWGIQAVFQHIKGVKDATSGYSGGSPKTAEYETVSTGQTGHAESVKVTFDPSQVSYGQLLKVFFSVGLDPTQLNRQGPDTGTQYRSVLFYANDEQKRVADAYIAQLDQAKVFSRPIVTQVVPLKSFYSAEPYHQNYATLHPDDPYIAFNDAPKVEHLKQQFPTLYKK